MKGKNKKEEKKEGRREEIDGYVINTCFWREGRVRDPWNFMATQPSWISHGTWLLHMCACVPAYIQCVRNHPSTGTCVDLRMSLYTAQICRKQRKARVSAVPSDCESTGVTNVKHTECSDPWSNGMPASWRRGSERNDKAFLWALCASWWCVH